MKVRRSIPMLSGAVSLGLMQTQPTRFSGNPVIPHTDTWKAGQTMECHVMTNPTDPTQLIMYYCGQELGGAFGHIARATAQITNPYVWRDTHTEILVCGADGAWDDDMIRMDSLVYDDGTYYIYFTGRHDNVDQVGLATSADGITFTKNAGNPIFTFTAPETNVSQAAVLKEGSNWYMWYAHRDGDDWLPNIKLATSSDGVNWTKTGIISWPKGAVGEYDSYYIEYHFIFKYNGLYWLAAECYNNDLWVSALAYSRTPTGVFTKLPTPMIQGSGVAGAFDRYHTSTPTIFNIQGRWLLFYQGAIQKDPYWTSVWDVGIAEWTPGPYWWLPTGLSASNCLAVYQPKGANSLAASYVNLSKAGTNNAAPGVAPTFDTTTGWTFNGTDQYLACGITPTNDQDFTILVRFSDVTSAGGKWIVGAGEGTNRYFGIQPIDDQTPSHVNYLNGAEEREGVGITEGVLGIAGNRGYRNGTAEGDAMGAWEGDSNRAIYIGAVDWQGSPAAYTACKIQAVAIYNTTLTPAQMAQVSAAMAAL